MINKLSNKKKVVLMSTIVFLLLLFHVWLRSLTVAEGYRVGQKRKVVKQISAQLRELHVIQNELMGPWHLERIVQRDNAKFVEPVWIKSSEKNTLFISETK